MSAMPTLLAAFLIALAVAVGWFSAAVLLALGIGRGIRIADERAGITDPLAEEADH